MNEGCYADNRTPEEQWAERRKFVRKLDGIGSSHGGRSIFECHVMEKYPYHIELYAWSDDPHEGYQPHTEYIDWFWDDNKATEVMKWLEEHFEDGVWAASMRVTSMPIIFFKYEVDAVAFKLRWC